MAIDITKYMVDLRGKKYLPVAPRIVMMRESNPEWSVITEPVLIDGLEPMVKATVLDNENNVMATAHKTITSFRGGAFEKAETGAIGRALSLCGFGTIQAGDMEEGDEIADSPVPSGNVPPRTTPKSTPRDPRPSPSTLTVFLQDYDEGKTHVVGSLYNIDSIRTKYNAPKHMMNALNKNDMVKARNQKVLEAGRNDATNLSTDLSKDTFAALAKWLIEREQG